MRRRYRDGPAAIRRPGGAGFTSASVAGAAARAKSTAPATKPADADRRHDDIGGTRVAPYSMCPCGPGGTARRLRQGGRRSARAAGSVRQRIDRIDCGNGRLGQRIASVTSGGAEWNYVVLHGSAVATDRFACDDEADAVLVDDIENRLGVAGGCPFRDFDLAGVPALTAERDLAEREDPGRSAGYGIADFRIGATAT